MRPGLVLLVLALGLCGCRTEEPRAERPQASLPLASLVGLVDASGAPAALAVVVRVTTERVVLLAALPRPVPAALVAVLGDERVPLVRADAPLGGGGPSASVGAFEVVVLEGARPTSALARTLRPLGPAARPGPRQPVVLVAGSPPGPTEAEVAEVGPARLLLAPLPPRDRQDVRLAAARAADTRGAPILTADGALLGFVTGVAEEQPVVTPLDALGDLVPLVLRAPGRDVLGPADETTTLRIEAVEVDAAPTLHDDWGGPDLFVLLRLGEEELPALSLDEASLGRPTLFHVAERGPVEARLVERDVSLGDGEQDELLADPVRFDALRDGPSRFAFRLLDAVLERHPEARAGPRVTRVSIEAEVVDPDAGSSPDRTPLGTLGHALGSGRVASGTLDEQGGDGTDFFAVDLGQPDDGPADMVLLVFCRDPQALVTAELFGPDLTEPLLRLEPLAGRRLGVAAGAHAPGRVFLRLASAGGPPRPAPYAALVAYRDDAAGLVRALFRLVAREAESPLPYLASREFAREVAVALTFDAALAPAAVAAALVDELGHRVIAARLLALNLLEVHTLPAQDALVRVARDSSHEARALDARLLLAARVPDGLFTDEAVALAARPDVDPLLKLRALEIASRVIEVGRRTRLEDVLARSDPSGLVARALGRLAPSSEQPGPR